MILLRGMCSNSGCFVLLNQIGSLKVVFHITQPTLERNPYVKSTVPVWAEATTEMARPLTAPFIPFKADLCHLDSLGLACAVGVINGKLVVIFRGLSHLDMEYQTLSTWRRQSYIILALSHIFSIFPLVPGWPQIFAPSRLHYHMQCQRFQWNW